MNLPAPPGMCRRDQCSSGNRLAPIQAYTRLRLIKTVCYICGATLLLASCSTVPPISPTGPNLLDTLPKEDGVTPVVETDRFGLVDYQGYVEAVHPAEQSVLVQGWVLPRQFPYQTPAPSPLSFTILPNTKIIRSSERSSLKELKPGEFVNVLAQPRPDGQLLTVSVAFFSKPQGYPVAKAVPGKPGWVYSPYAPSERPVNVSGIPAGSEALCPYTKKIFLTPF